jgi:peroxiredoxin
MIFHSTIVFFFTFAAIKYFNLFNCMKQIISLLVIAFAISSAIAQEDFSKRKMSLPSVDLKTLNGKTFNTQDMDNNEKPIIICFFATWCKPCMTELKAISDVYDDWQDETGVKIYAISIDDSRSSAKVSPLVKGQNWDYEFLLDENSDFKRAMNVNDIPHTFVLNKNKEIVWQHTSYSPGAEQEYINIVRKLIAEPNK